MFPGRAEHWRRTSGLLHEERRHRSPGLQGMLRMADGERVERARSCFGCERAKNHLHRRFVMPVFMGPPYLTGLPEL